MEPHSAALNTGDLTDGEIRDLLSHGGPPNLQPQAVAGLLVTLMPVESTQRRSKFATIASALKLQRCTAAWCVTQYYAYSAMYTTAFARKQLKNIIFW